MVMRNEQQKGDGNKNKKYKREKQKIKKEKITERIKKQQQQEREQNGKKIKIGDKINSGVFSLYTFNDYYHCTLYSFTDMSKSSNFSLSL